MTQEERTDTTNQTGEADAMASLMTGFLVGHIVTCDLMAIDSVEVKEAFHTLVTLRTGIKLLIHVEPLKNADSESACGAPQTQKER